MSNTHKELYAEGKMPTAFSAGHAPSEKAINTLREKLTGVPLSEDVKKKISEATKGREFSEEHKRNIGISKTGDKNPHYGKKASEETRAKMRASNKRPNAGKTASEETRVKMKDAHAKRRVRPDDPNYKLTEENVKQIIALLDIHTSKELGEMFGVAPTTIGGIRRNITWKHIERII